MVEPGGIEPPTSCVQGRRSPSWAMAPRDCHYTSLMNLVGLGRFELPTSALSGMRSNQLSYRPKNILMPGNSSSEARTNVQGCAVNQITCEGTCILHYRDFFYSLKEVIQPHVPVRLPCYDFTPVIDHTVVSALPRVKLPTSGATNFHGVTGGVYKTRERIHRDILIRDY